MLTETARSAIIERCWNDDKSKSENVVTLSKYLMSLEKNIRESGKKRPYSKGDIVRFPIGIALVNTGKAWELNGNY